MMDSTQRAYMLMDLLRLTTAIESVNGKDTIVMVSPLTYSERESIKAQLFLELGINLNRQ